MSRKGATQKREKKGNQELPLLDGHGACRFEAEGTEDWEIQSRHFSVREDASVCPFLAGLGGLLGL